MRKEDNLNQPEKRIIISGGGTGGHVFPALAIAEALMQLDNKVKLLFVGANGKIEMQKVPAAGFQIEGLDIRGLQRSLSWENLKFPFRLIKSILRSKAIIKSFKPEVAVGVGGYASGPLLFVAATQGIPCLIQEQNSYPGITNKLLAKKAARICVAYEGMNRFFPKDHIYLTGNPVRKSITDNKILKAQALEHFGFTAASPVLLVLGGSLGAGTLNESVFSQMEKLASENIQLIWQTGPRYFQSILNRVGQIPTSMRIVEFIVEMEMAYAAADVIISRAGAGTISELAFTDKAVILVPSPNVAEDHQTRNAEALVSTQAALMVSDREAIEKLIPLALKLLKDGPKRATLGVELARHAFPNAASDIARQILNLIKDNQGDEA